MFKNWKKFILLLKTLKFFTSINGTYFKTKYDFIEIDITYDCNLKCLNCNRSCRQAPSKESMTVEQIKKFIKESIAQDRKWKGIRILGGEPSTHNNILEILNLILEYKKFSPDIMLRYATNGIGTKANDILNKIPKEFIIENSRKNTIKQIFSPFNYAPADSLFYKFIDYAHACSITQNCGLGLTSHGYYHCAVAGGIDRVFGLNLGRKKLPNSGDQMLKEKRLLCKYCGHFRDLFESKLIMEEKISKTWRQAYKKYDIQSPDLSIY